MGRCRRDPGHAPNGLLRRAEGGSHETNGTEVVTVFSSNCNTRYSQFAGPESSPHSP
jgi:hypothetical protein